MAAEYEKIKITDNVATAASSRLVSQQPDTGELNYVDAVNLPISTATREATVCKRTISQIRALSGVLPNNYLYTTDIGQEGNWYHDASDTTTSDNTGTVLVTADGKRVKRIYSGAANVSWYGVFPNLGTDFSSNIVNILGLHNEIFFPEGSYTISISTATTFNNKILRGVKPSWNGTTITGGTKITGSIGVVGSDNLFSNLGIYNVAGNGITVRTNASRNVIESCIFNVQDHAVLVEQFGGTATDNVVRDSEAYGGIHGFVSKSRNLSFINCRSYGASQDGFAMVSDNITGSAFPSLCKNNILLNCEAHNTNTGIRLYSRDYSSTTNVNGILLLNLKIIGGNIDTCSAYGIRVGDDVATGSVPVGQTYNDVSNIAITGISIQNTATYNIQLGRCNGVYIGGNTFKGVVNKQYTLAKNLVLAENTNNNFSLGSAIYNTINPVNSNSIDASLVNRVVETNNTDTTVLTMISNGKVGQVLQILINDDFTTIATSVSFRLTKGYIKGKGSFVVLKYANDGSGWDELYSTSTRNYQFFGYNADMDIDYKFFMNAETRLTGNIDTIVFSNVPKGTNIKLVMQSDGNIGGRTVAGWDSRIAWLGGIPPTAINANDRLVLDFYYNGTTIANTGRTDFAGISISPNLTCSTAHKLTQKMNLSD